MQHPHLDTPVSPLRQRLIDDMNMRRFSRETQRNYLRDIGRLAAFLGRSPDTATADDLRRVPDMVASLIADGVRVTRVEPHVPTLEDLYFTIRRESGVGERSIAAPGGAARPDGGLR